MKTLHVLSSPYQPVHKNNTVDPFSPIVFKFIKNMTQLGWPIVHYGMEGSEVDSENVICLKNNSFKETERVQTYNRNAGKEISKRKKPGDLILCYWGTDNQIAAEMNNDCQIIEPSIGYSTNAVFAPFRVFTSYAQMHFYYGQKGMLMNPSWFDQVIYNNISSYDFEFNINKKDYFLYFGRVIESKGLHIAIQATEAAGVKLIIAGPGSLYDLGYSTIPNHVEIAGICDKLKRKELMKYAKGILGPTYYIEPFGNMIVEGYMSGTPAITTDWGAFTETVVQGETGFRCREFNEFVNAIKNINQIDPYDCRKWAVDNCDDSIVYEKYNQYFKKIIQGNFYRI